MAYCPHCSHEMTPLGNYLQPWHVTSHVRGAAGHPQRVLGSVESYAVSSRFPAKNAKKAKKAKNA